MAPSAFDTPILFLVFNRPDTTRRVFEEIRKRKPRRLYVAADGPRPTVPDDHEDCRETREVVSSTDWECEVKTLFRDSNLGCRNAVQGALDWFFSHEEEGIVLEDDTLPDEGFFDYCATMLNRFRDDPRILSVNGCNLGYRAQDRSAALTVYFNMWGWATWRRSNELVGRTWEAYRSGGDLALDRGVVRRLRLKTIWDDRNWIAYWQRVFSSTARGEFNTWDYQWLYAALKTESFCIRPGTNHVVNIGFGAQATHTKFDGLELARMTYGTAVVEEAGQEPRMVRDRIYENNFVTRVWTRYNIFANSRLYTLYSEARRRLWNRG